MRAKGRPLPARRTQKLPVLLNRTPYDKSFPPITLNTLDVVRAAGAGYNVVVQDCRGLFASQGTFRCFVDEARDGYDTIEYLARQPFADGKVGTFGASYMGATQWLAATQRPPSLKAMVPSITASDYHDGWVYQGGAFELFFSVSWLMITLGLSRLMRERAANPKAAEELSALMGSIDVMRERMEFTPIGEFPLFRTGAPYFFDWLAHPYYDDYWRAICIEEQHDKIDVPALNVGGWHDIFMGGTLRNYLGMRARGPPPTRARASACWSARGIMRCHSRAWWARSITASAPGRWRSTMTAPNCDGSTAGSRASTMASTRTHRSGCS